MKVATLNTLSAFLSNCDERYTTSGDAVTYTITRLGTPTSGYLASYQLYKNSTAVGDVINIPKDYLVKSAELKTCTAANTPVTGYKVGDKYIDFVVNTVGGDGSESHIYLLVSDLVDTYTGGNGISISNQNVVSVNIGTANGLSVDGNGLNLATATTSTAGAMSAADKTRLSNCALTSDFEEITSAEVAALFA